MNVNFHIAKWAGEGWRLIGPEHAATEEEVQAAETRLGFRLPEALRYWYLWAGKYAKFRHYEDEIPSLKEIAVYAGHLIFMWEREGSCIQGIPLAHLDEPDPIFWWQYSGESPESPWEDTCLYDDIGCRVSDWFTDKVLDDVSEDMTLVILSEERLARLETAYPLLRTNLYAATEGTEGGYFADHETLIFRSPGSSHLRVTAQTLEAAQRFCTQMGINESPEKIVRPDLGLR